jgi:hypothetical protein
MAQQQAQALILSVLDLLNLSLTSENSNCASHWSFRIRFKDFLAYCNATPKATKVIPGYILLLDSYRVLI